MFRGNRKGRFLRHKGSTTPATCSCAWPLPLPWRRFHAGAVWECGDCHQQWEWISRGDARGWRRLPVEAWVLAEPIDDGAPVPAAWRSILHDSDPERV